MASPTSPWLLGLSLVVLSAPLEWEGSAGCPQPQEANPERSRPRPFAIQVVDEASGRGVPLVRLQTTNAIEFFTDSQGLVAVDEPGLLGRRVFFSISSHGYEYPADGFGYRGRALLLEPAGSAVLKIKRLNVAERLYRVTGQGLYAETLRLGRQPPIEQAALNGQVMGQDSVQAAVYRGKVSWFWGDTSRTSYPLGHFGTAGAVSDLPGKGGLDPSVGVNLRYWTDEGGFSRPMFRLEKPGMVWIDGLLTVTDPEGRERLLCHYSRMKDLGTRLGHGLAVFDDQEQRFIPLRELGEQDHLHPLGHAFRVEDPSGDATLYFATPYPLVRVRARWDDVLDPTRYEAFTPLKEGSSFNRLAPELDRTPDGSLHYAWKRNTGVVMPLGMRELVEQGALKPSAAWPWPVDSSSGKPVLLHAGSVRWNPYRQRFIMIAVETFGGPSFLGEVYYLESRRPEGPWPRAVKILTHDRYSFYNPCHHAFFDLDGGRLIHFEGTYSHTFSGNDHPTPRYDYNQILYRLDLADKRLQAAHCP